MPRVSVVCPLYNESAIIEKAAQQMLQNLAKLPYDWELIVVNDGSRDDSLARLTSAVNQHPRVKVLTYPVNRGMGHALRYAIDRATGDFVVATEIDLSWGDDIVGRLAATLESDPKVDCVIASPNLPGGGYRNVPFKRVMVSRLGNLLLRLFFTGSVTMNTGLTRAYRREVIQGLVIEENGKEIHLEELMKMLALGYTVKEIPAVLAWRDHELLRPGAELRQSSSRIGRLVRTHLRFAFFARPMRYLWATAAMLMLAGLFFTGMAIHRFFAEQVYAYTAIAGLMAWVFALIFFAFGILTEQNLLILKQGWRKLI